MTTVNRFNNIIANKKKSSKNSNRNRITYKGWLEKKKTEEVYRKILVETERKEQNRIQQQKEEEDKQILEKK